MKIAQVTAEGHLVRSIAAGQVFGAVPLFTRTGYPASATAVVDSLAARWDQRIATGFEARCVGDCCGSGHNQSLLTIALARVRDSVTSSQRGRDRSRLLCSRANRRRKSGATPAGWERPHMGAEGAQAATRSIDHALDCDPAGSKCPAGYKGLNQSRTLWRPRLNAGVPIRIQNSLVSKIAAKTWRVSEGVAAT